MLNEILTRKWEVRSLHGNTDYGEPHNVQDMPCPTEIFVPCFDCDQPDSVCLAGKLVAVAWRVFVSADEPESIAYQWFQDLDSHSGFVDLSAIDNAWFQEFIDHLDFNHVRMSVYLEDFRESMCKATLEVEILDGSGDAVWSHWDCVASAHIYKNLDDDDDASISYEICDLCGKGLTEEDFDNNMAGFCQECDGVFCTNCMIGDTCSDCMM